MVDLVTLLEAQATGTLSPEKVHQGSLSSISTIAVLLFLLQNLSEDFSVNATHCWERFIPVSNNAHTSESTAVGWGRGGIGERWWASGLAVGGLVPDQG